MVNTTANCQPGNATTNHPKSVQYYARAIHRVLGFLTLGLVIMFSLSGVILVHRSGDFMKQSKHIEKTIDANLNEEQLAGALRIRRLTNAEKEGDIIRFADGQYNVATGEVSYETKQVVSPFDRFIKLHVVSDGRNPGVAWFVTIFGIALFLLAVTSLFMFKVRSQQFKSGMIWTGIGLVLAIVLAIVI